MPKVVIDIEDDISLNAALELVSLTLARGRISTARGVSKCAHVSVYRGLEIYARDRKTESSPDSFVVRKYRNKTKGSNG